MAAIITITELQQSGVKEFVHQNRPALVVLTERGVRAFYNACTHDGASVCALVGRDLQCCLHGARFNPATGKALCRPAPLDSKLTAIPIHMDGDTVCVD